MILTETRHELYGRENLPLVFPEKNKMRAGLEEVGSFFWGGGNGEPSVPRKIESFNHHI
jgi:hypothetical protein